MSLTPSPDFTDPRSSWIEPRTSTPSETRLSVLDCPPLLPSSKGIMSQLGPMSLAPIKARVLMSLAITENSDVGEICLKPRVCSL